MSNSHLADLSLNPVSISDLTGTNVSEGMQRGLVNNAIRQLGSMIKADLAANAGTITSASTFTLASISTGDYILLTPSGGSTSISSFGTATEGLEKHLEALGTVILRHDSAKLNLPGGSDLTISTGDVIFTRAMGGTVWKVTHDPYKGIPQSIYNAASATVSSTTKLLAITGGVESTALVSELLNLGSNSPYLALSAAHTISAGNRDAVLNFTTAGVTCNFDTAASLSSGFMVTIMNTAASGDVTLDPNGAETLDGLATRLLRPGDRVKIIDTGSAWITEQGVYSYDSGATSISTGGAVVMAHGLGVSPALDSIECTLTNVTTQENWTAGQVMKIPFGGYQNAAESNNFTCQPDATNLNLQYGSTAIAGINRTTGAIATLTPANWSLRIIAYKRY